MEPLPLASREAEMATENPGEFPVDYVLTDIEGTTSSVSFVTDVLFPYAQRRHREFLQTRGDEPPAQEALALMARDAGASDLAHWLPHDLSKSEAMRWVGDRIDEWMAGDAKLTGLKALQGLIWEDGFYSGELVAHVYDDVPVALSKWHKQEIPLGIYSSGSVHAQKLFFAHTSHGNLLPFFENHFDTAVGGKKSSESYRRIASALGRDAEGILFLSDIEAELDAAREIGVQVCLLVRPGAAKPSGNHRQVTSFADLRVVKRNPRNRGC